MIKLALALALALACLLLLLGAMGYGVYRFVKAAPRLAFLAAVALTLGLPLAGKAYMHRHYLEFLPAELGDAQVLYNKEEAWGFGPGGNETGVIVYGLPEMDPAAIEQLALRQSASPESLLDARNPTYFYHHWTPTPVLGNPDWTVFEAAQGEGIGRPGLIGNYLDQYGFSIDIDPSVERTIDDALSQPGNFVAQGRSGVLILIPRQKQAVFAYAG